jgi:thiamine-phosphate pyrophosphorylase
MTLPRVYPILDGALLEDRGIRLAEAADALLEAGARLIQLRWKDHFSRAIFAEAEQIALQCRSADAMLIMNDRADIAALLDTGLHLGQDDLPPVHARRIVGTDRPIGFSTHNEEQFRAGDQEPVDYLAIGPIFSTTNKLNPDPVVGVGELARLRTSTTKPVVAIGGINRTNAHEVWRAGANAVAIIGDMFPEACTATAIKDRFEEWMRIAADD